MAKAPRVPPHSDEAEKSVLGAVLIDKDAVVAVAQFLKPNHFYRESHGRIFEAVLALYGQREPVDVVTV